VAVEKVGFSEKSQKSGDRKCPGGSKKSFIELPYAKQFLRNRSERIFQQPQDLSTSIRLRSVSGTLSIRLAEVKSPQAAPAERSHPAPSALSFYRGTI
jgi:hypothetical protein